jgi:hypothetical protein
MAVEYQTALHAQPLVLIPKMGIIYLKDDTRGYQMTSQFLKNIDVQMDLIIADGGSVCFKPFHTYGRRMVLWLLNSEGYSYASVSGGEAEWDDMCKALLRVQRFTRSVLWRTRMPAHHLQNVKAFQATDMAGSLPVDVVSKIIIAYFDANVQ